MASNGDAIPEYSGTTMAGSAVRGDLYKSWSLFLITNYNWLERQNDGILRDLYEEFQTFGISIGHDDLAVWFWRRPPQPNELYRDVLDIDRSIAICKSLRLKPKDGPFIIVTSTYPGRCLTGDAKSFPKNTDGMLIICLGQTDAETSRRFLHKLSDKITSEGLASASFSSDAYANELRRVFKEMSNMIDFAISAISLEYDDGSLVLKANMKR